MQINHKQIRASHIRTPIPVFGVGGQGRRTSAFSVIELLVAMVVLAVLATLLLGVLGRVKESSRTAGSISNLRQLHIGATGWAVENDGNFPSIYDYPPARSAVWHNAVTSIVYPEIAENALRKAGTLNTWIWNYWSSDYEGTIFRSPNAEPDSKKNVPSYGYNSKFGAPRNLMIVFSPSETVMFGDNDGAYPSHSLNPAGSTSYGTLNPRNGASQPHARDGNAAVIYLDGHVELLDAARSAELTANPNHPFWGR